MFDLFVLQSATSNLQGLMPCQMAKGIFLLSFPQILSDVILQDLEFSTLTVICCMAQGGRAHAFGKCCS